MAALSAQVGLFQRKPTLNAAPLGYSKQSEVGFLHHVPFLTTVPPNHLLHIDFIFVIQVREDGLLLFSCHSSFRSGLAECRRILLVSSFLGAGVASLQLFLLAGLIEREGLVDLFGLDVAAGVFVSPLQGDDCVDFLVGRFDVPLGELFDERA